MQTQNDPCLQYLFVAYFDACCVSSSPVFWATGGPQSPPSTTETKLILLGTLSPDSRIWKHQREIYNPFFFIFEIGSNVAQTCFELVTLLRVTLNSDPPASHC